MEDETMTDETTSQELEPQSELEVPADETAPATTDDAPIVEEVAATAPPAAVEHASPYRQQAAPGSMPAEYAEVFDPKVYDAIERMIERRADERVAMALQAQAQSREAVRELGLPQSVADEYGTSMARYETQIPAEMRGTKQGAIAAFSLALGEKMMAGTSVADVLKSASSHFDTKPAQLATARTIPAEERMTSPRATAVLARVTGERKPTGPYSYLASRWGMTAEEERGIREAGEETIAADAARRR